MRSSYDLFLSYSHTDREKVLGIRSALIARGITTYLDRYDAPVGEPWLPALETALHHSKAVAIFVGGEDLGSWQKRELWSALDRQAKESAEGRIFPVIPVLLRDINFNLVPGFLFQNTWIDLRQSDVESELNRFAAAIVGKKVGAPTHAEVFDICPFRGLHYFREIDAPIFFGRRAVTEELFKAVSALDLVAVVGTSGSGKSSLVRAGLLPALRRQRPPQPTWEISLITPGDNPNQSLASGLVRLWHLSDIEQLESEKALAEHLDSGKIDIKSAIQRTVEKNANTDKLLIVVDQFERLFSQAEDATISSFVNLLIQGARTKCATVLIILRADYYGAAINCHRELSDFIQHGTINVGPMEREDLRQIIELPLRNVNLGIEAGLVDQILDQVAAQPGNLSLLEFALTQLWEKRDSHSLTYSNYKRIGQLNGAIATHADAVFTRLTPRQQDIARDVLLSLVRVRPDGGSIARRATFDEYSQDAQAIIAHLSNERLLVTGRNESSGIETVELTHEALIVGWGKLSDWLKANQEFLLWRERFRVLQSQWLRNNEDPSALLRGFLLNEAERWTTESRHALTDHEVDFIRASLSFREEEHLAQEELRKREERHAQELAREQARGEMEANRANARAVESARLKRFLAVVVVLCCALAVLVWLTLRQYESSKRESLVSLSRQLTIQSQQFLNPPVKIPEALLLAVAAVRISPTYDGQDALLRILQVIPYPITFLWGHNDTVFDVVASNNGNLAASAGRDKTIRLWNLKRLTLLREPLEGHSAAVLSLAIDSQDSVLASSDASGKVILWSLSNFRQLGDPLERPQSSEPAVRVAMNPIRPELAVGYADGEIIVWNLITSKILGSAMSQNSTILSLAYSPNGRVIVSGDEDGYVMFWDAKEKRSLGTRVKAHDGPVFSLAFSPDGAKLATAGGDRKIRFMDPRSRQLLRSMFEGHRDEVLSVAFGPDANTLVSSGRDQTVMVWDLSENATRGDPMQVHVGPVIKLAPAAGGTKMLSSGRDGVLVVWDMTSRAPLGTRLASTPTDGEEFVVAVNGIGEEVVTFIPGKARWIKTDFAGRRSEDVVRPINGLSPMSMAVSPSSRYVATVSDDGNVSVYDHATKAWIDGVGKASHQPVRLVKFGAKDTALYVGTAIDEVSMWSVTDPFKVRSYRFENQSGISDMSISLDGNTVVAAHVDGRVTIANAQSGRTLGVIEKHIGQVYGVTLSDDGHLVASFGADGLVHISNTSDGGLVGTLQTADLGPIRTLAFSHDGRRMATGGEDGAIVLWDLETQRVLGTPFIGHNDSVRYVGFRKNDKSVVSVGSDGETYSWDVDLDSWIARACVEVNRDFSAPERDYHGFGGRELPSSVCPR